CRPCCPAAKCTVRWLAPAKCAARRLKWPNRRKKKNKTGRAKRRIQYNKRFVATVNLPGGRRRGPNANS
uniref:40S ribosomal protein S30 n=1 Tax=Macrostomum lignano TaxID=282301 RepID=A0A1I8JMS0_9PLAT